MLEKVTKLIDLDKNKEDIYDSPDGYFKKFAYKKAKTILINKSRVFGIFEHADQFSTIYAVQYDEKKRPLFLAYGWESIPACLESLYELKDSLKELDAVLEFTYKKV